MKTRTLLLMLSLMVMLTVSPVESWGANSKVGTYAYPFLKIPVGAKAPAMGGAYTGLSNDVAGMYFNPAGITQVEGSEISASYNNYLTDIQGGYVSYITSRGQNGKIGLAINYLNYGSTPKTDESGNDLGEFGGGDFAASATIAWRFLGETEEAYEVAESRYEDKESHPRWNGLSLGLTAKFVYESLDEYSSDALAVDIGVMYGLKDDRTRLGASASNLGFQLKGLSPGHKDAMPAILRFGVGHQLKAAPLIIAVDAVKPMDNDVHFAAGLNFTQFYPVQLRAGYTTLGKDMKTGSDKDNWGGLSFGLGLKLNKFLFDYAVVPYADLGTSHRVGISSRW